jgi:hypothetical protein
MASSHPHLFQSPIAEVLQWRPATGEDIPTPNTNKIVVFASF